MKEVRKGRVWSSGSGGEAEVLGRWESWVREKFAVCQESRLVNISGTFNSLTPVDFGFRKPR